METIFLKPFFFILITYSIAIAEEREGNDQNWQGHWFPYSPGSQQDPNTKIANKHDSLYDPKHQVVMGIKNPRCDDAKRNLQIDWDFSPINHTCFIFNRRSLFRARSDVQPVLSRDFIPLGYSAIHKCMDQAIEYDTVIPTYGPHRPLWAKYGEYLFLPKQRWVHNLEHGAIVMLYHPCADKNEVNLLRIIVKKCLYRHVITPYNLLSPERPLALVAWSYRLEMSKVAPEIVLDFIKKYALKGPEQTFRDGQYDLMLEQHANVVSDLSDSDVCKVYDFMQ